jgi:hypothetical protein
MRHYFSPGPVTAHPGGMHLATATGLLVALPGREDVLPPRPGGTASRAIDLPPVAAAADDHLRTAAGT